MREQRENEMFENNPFIKTSYKTSADRKRSFFDRLFFGSRLPFHLKMAANFYSTGTCGKRGELDAKNQAYYSYKNLLIAEDCGAKFEVTGLQHMDSFEGPCVFIANHMSLLETAVLCAFTNPRKPAIYVVKQALFNIPFYGDIMRGMDNIAVGRENPRDDLKAVLQGGKERLDKGCSIIIFPQSTRADKFDPQKFNSIGLKLAKKAGVPVVPIALKTDFLGNGKKLKDFGPINREKVVHFEFGAPRIIEGNGKQAQEDIIEFIQDHLKKWEQ